MALRQAHRRRAALRHRAAAGAAGAPPAGAPQGGGQQAAAPVEKLGDGAFKIGGNYASLAVDMGDHVLVIESGQSDARGMAVMAAAKQAIPGKPIRFVVNSHPHFDHASGLAAAVAEGATILTHNNNEVVLERLLAGPRTLTGDSLSKVSNRRTNVVTGVGDRDVRKGTNGKVVELHRVPNEHSDGMLVVYLPAEKVLWSADITAVNPNPAQLGVTKATAEAVNRLKLDFNAFIPAHPPNPERPLTKADLMAAAARVRVGTPTTTWTTFHHAEADVRTLLQLALLALFPTTALAQWANIPPRQIPRTPDGQPNLSAPAPRLPDGKPDFSGIWNPPTGYLRNLARDLKDDVPFQPWAKAIYDERAAGLHWKEEPDANCLPQGVPKVLLAPAPWRILQTPGRLLRPRSLQSLVAGIPRRPPIRAAPRRHADLAWLFDGEVGRRHARRRERRLQRQGLARSAR